MIRLTLIQGHVLKVLKKIPDESIDCIITSPPYWGLRKYPDSANVVWGGDPNCEHEWESIVKPKERGRMGKSSWERPSREVNPGNEPQVSSFCKKCGAWYGQLGLEPTLEMYLDHLLEITAELKRVLKPTGILFWNHGDCYIGSGPTRHLGYADPKYPEGRKVNYIEPQSLPQKLPPKCVAMQNFRLALRMIDEQGWILRNVIIWYKPNHLPESVKDRFTKAYEPIFMFVKKKKYYFNLDAVRVPIKSIKDKRLNEHNFVNPVEMGYNSKHKGKDISPFKTIFSFNYRVREAKKGHFGILGVRASKEEMEKYDNKGVRIKHDIAVGRVGNFSYEVPLHTKPVHPKGKNPGDVWEMTTEPFPEAHFATFPTKLVRRCIKCGCPPNGIVLDPFVGSGTTLKVAIEERRNAIGIEIVPEYIEITKKRLNWGSSLGVEFRFFEEKEFGGIE